MGRFLKLLKGEKMKAKERVMIKKEEYDIVNIMDRDEFIHNKFITVAGRATSMEEFASMIKNNLYDNFEIVAIHGLGEFAIDDKERYLAFVTGESKSGQTFN